VAIIILAVAYATATTGNLKKKRRGLNAPCIEAPLSACQRSTPSRAHLGALGRFFDGLGKLAVFDAARSRSYAKLLIKLYFDLFYLLAPPVCAGNLSASIPPSLRFGVTST
jgi:hypothetical protein